jgi:hypothetical protein
MPILTSAAARRFSDSTLDMSVRLKKSSGQWDSACVCANQSNSSKHNRNHSYWLKRRSKQRFAWKRRPWWILDILHVL